MATEKLFWKDPAQTECEAAVTEVSGRTIKIDRTVFFAFSGGQESDDGTIGGIRVLEARKLGDKEHIIDIEYVLEQGPPFRAGDRVTVRIDGQKRERLRKLHTATHLAYYFVAEHTGELPVIGSNVASDKARIDFAIPENIASMLPEAEARLNAFIAENHEIRREPDAKNPDLWWWFCGPWKMPCGGTHVWNTKEIGPVALKRKTKGAGKERVEIFVGAAVTGNSSVVR